MDAHAGSRHSRPDAMPEGPLRLLVSTSAGSDRAETLGHADYSYGFVLEAYAPVLERIGRLTRIDRPESRLVPLAERALAAGERPVHLAFAPLHKIYLTPAVPTIAFPFWEFPDLPDRAFGTDSRQDWTRIARYVDGIAASCAMTARSFDGSARGRVSIVPVPLRDGWFDVEPWHSGRTVSLECKHLSFAESAGRPTPPAMAPLSAGERTGRALKSLYARHVWPRMTPGQRRLVHRIARRTIRRDAERHVPLERRVLTLGGLVFSSVFNLLDDRKNPRDILTAFLMEFAGRDDATLVLKLTSCPRTEREIVARLRALHRSLGIEHRCRVAAILDYLDDRQMDALMGATTAYVNASHGEGACLPLQQAMAAGRPVIAPAHTAMADYVDERVGAVVASSAEPTHWPHDPERRIETTWRRIDWESLRAGLRLVADAADRDRGQYGEWSRAARARMQAWAGAAGIEARLRGLLENVVARGRWGSLDWREAGDERAADGALAGAA